MELFNVYPLFDVTPVSAKGAYVFDKQGERYLDFYGGHAVISIGHNHPHYLHRIKRQLEKISFYSNSIINPLQQELAHKLGQMAGLDDYQLFLCNSGAEANENALKLASFANRRNKFIAFNKGFHGRTSAAVNVTDNKKIQAPINQHLEVLRFDLDDLNTVCSTIEGGDIGAIILEPIQGIGGMNEMHVDGLERIRQACSNHGTLMILDEVQSGYARSGKFFAYQYASIKPDLITCAKGMGNGFPIGGVLIHPSIQARYGMLGTTFGGNHLACAAGLAVLEVIEKEQLMANAIEMGNLLSTSLKSHESIKAIRGKGLMLGLEFNWPVADLRKHLIFNHKVFTGSSSNPNVLRLLPPLTIGDHEVEQFLEAVTQSLKNHSVAL